jgi:hypothetical protein
MAFCHPTRLTIVRARWWRPVRPSMRQSTWPSMAHLTVLVYCKHLHHCTIRFHASTLWQQQDKVHETHTTPHGAEYVWTRSRLVCDWRVKRPAKFASSAGISNEALVIVAQVGVTVRCASCFTCTCWQWWNHFGTWLILGRLEKLRVQFTNGRRWNDCNHFSIKERKRSTLRMFLPPFLRMLFCFFWLAVILLYQQQQRQRCGSSKS